MIGGDTHRPKEELISAGGYIDKGRFQRVRTLRELDESLAAATAAHRESVRQTLLTLYTGVLSCLIQALEAWMKDRVDGLQQRLEERATKEADNIGTVLAELQRAIAGELKGPATQQGYLPGMEPNEVEQFRHNREARRAGSKEISGGIERETAAIQPATQTCKRGCSRSR